MSDRERAIQQAIQDFHSGKFASQRAAAAAHKIPRSTFRSRLDGGTSDSRSSHTHQQRLTPAEEQFLVEWILEQDLQGLPPSHARTREMAARVLLMRNETRPLGRKWTEHFVRRNPRVSGCVGRRVAASEKTTREVQVELSALVGQRPSPPACGS